MQIFVLSSFINLCHFIVSSSLILSFLVEYHVDCMNAARNDGDWGGHNVNAQIGAAATVDEHGNWWEDDGTKQHQTIISGCHGHGLEL